MGPLDDIIEGCVLYLIIFGIVVALVIAGLAWMITSLF